MDVKRALTMRAFGQHLIRALGWCAPAALLIALLGFAALQPDDDDIDSVVDATVKVTATGCRNTLGEGIGTFIAPNLILTSAHTLAGADDIEITGRSGVSSASIVAFDPHNDLALIEVATPHFSVIPLGEQSLRLVFVQIHFFSPFMLKTIFPIWSDFSITSCALFASLILKVSKIVGLYLSFSIKGHISLTT